jgi:hypothetical protein
MAVVRILKGPANLSFSRSAVARYSLLVPGSPVSSAPTLHSLLPELLAAAVSR